MRKFKEFLAEQEKKDTYVCPKCSGKGYIAIYANYAGGVCFSCSGRGYKVGKAPTKSIKWVVFGLSKETGKAKDLYNISAKSADLAIKKAEETFLKASADFRNEYSIKDAVAIMRDELVWENNTYKIIQKPDSQ